MSDPHIVKGPYLLSRVRYEGREMAVTSKKTDEVLASARRELQAQLGVVREELARLANEERTLTRALSSINGGASSSATDGTASSRPADARASKSRRSARKTTSGRRKRGGTKSTADRVEELRGLLADGPRSRGDLAAALKVSPARVQQLLAQLGSAVSSQPDPNNGQVKLWTLAGGGNGASAEATRTGSRGRAKGSPRKPAARRKQATK